MLAFGILVLFHSDSDVLEIFCTYMQTGKLDTRLKQILIFSFCLKHNIYSFNVKHFLIEGVDYKIVWNIILFVRNLDEENVEFTDLPGDSGCNSPQPA